MKVFSAVLLAAVPAWAQESLTLQQSGDPANRFDLVILGDGYTAAEQEKFDNDAQALTDYLFSGTNDTEPFLRYRSYFNVHRVNLISNESGIDRPAQGIYRDTALDGAFSGRLSVHAHKVTTAARSAPGLDGVIVLMNESGVGGYAESYIALVACSNLAVAAHELGHTIFGVVDEYLVSQSSGFLENPAPNADTNGASPKWQRWIGVDPAIGAFQPGIYLNYYRPTEDGCRMKKPGSPSYCSVCREAGVLRIYRRVDPIDAFSPLDPMPVVALGDSMIFSVTPMQPAGTPLTVLWTVDGTAQSDRTDFLLDSTRFGIGRHEIVVTVLDPTNLALADPEGLLRGTARWTVQVVSPDSPAAPSGVSAQSTTDGSRLVVLTWSPSPETDVIGYRVYRSTESNRSYSVVGTSSLSQFADTCPTLGTTYFYRISAVDAQGLESPLSSEVPARPLDLIPPSTPTGLTATPGPDGILLRWIASPDLDVSGYLVWRGPSRWGVDGAMDLIAWTSSASYQDAKVRIGTYGYVVEALDGSGNRSPKTPPVYADSSVDLVTPVAVAGPDRNVRVRDSLLFDGSASSDPEGAPLFFTWDFGDGSPTVSQVAVAHAYAAPGTYLVLLKVRDPEGYTSQDSALVTVRANQSPIASAGPDQIAKAGDSLTFDGTASFDPDGNALAHEWDFGDGSGVVAGAIADHVYSVAGVYSVRLRVVDADGASAEDRLFVTVRWPRIHVSEIVMSSTWLKGGYVGASGLVRIVGEDGLPVSGVQVQASWSGATTRSQSATTDSRGWAYFSSGTVKNGGTFTLSVLGASKSGLEYDPAADVESSDSVTRTKK